MIDILGLFVEKRGFSPVIWQYKYQNEYLNKIHVIMTEKSENWHRET